MKWRVMMETTSGQQSQVMEARTVLQVTWDLEDVVNDTQQEHDCEVTSLTITREPS